MVPGTPSQKRPFIKTTGICRVLGIFLCIKIIYQKIRYVTIKKNTSHERTHIENHKISPMTKSNKLTNQTNKNHKKQTTKTQETNRQNFEDSFWFSLSFLVFLVVFLFYCFERQKQKSFYLFFVKHIHAKEQTITECFLFFDDLVSVKPNITY